MNKNKLIQAQKRYNILIFFSFMTTVISSVKTNTMTILFLTIFLYLEAGLSSQQVNSQNQRSQPTEKEWTYLIYMNGHNNLSSYADLNLRDIERAGGSDDNINIVVEWGSAKTNITKRLLVQKTTNATTVTSPTLMELPNHDMGNYENLIAFLKWGISQYPAKHYFVAVWNHGSGWHSLIQNNGLTQKNINLLQPLDISFDDVTKNKISTVQLGLALNEAAQFAGQKIDIYGSDACLMQMIEIASELKNSVNFIAGSQELEPGEGWPYLNFIKKWKLNPSISEIDLLKLLTHEFKLAYSSGGIYREKEDITFSGLNLNYLPEVENKIQNLSTQVSQLDQIQFALFRKSNLSSTKFAYSDYVDLGDLIKNIKKQNITAELTQLTSEIEALYKKLIISSENGPAYPRATGLSIWLPYRENIFMKDYLDLNFTKSTQWNLVVSRYLAK